MGLENGDWACPTGLQFMPYNEHVAKVAVGSDSKREIIPFA